MAELNHKIKFYLESEDEDWPPCQVETLWAKHLGRNLYELDSIPFFVKGLALGDVVSVERASGELLFKEIVRSGGHSTIRIIFLNHSVKDETCKRLEDIGCSWEGSHLPSLIAVDVPPSLQYDYVKAILERGEQTQEWEYEEGCVRAM